MLEPIVRAACRLTDARHCAVRLNKDAEPAGELEVPVCLEDRVIGQLCLSGKRGGGRFTRRDEEVAEALATAAAAAIDQALAQRRQRWLLAAAEITSALLDDVRPSEALALAATRARDLADAQLAMVLLADGDRLTVEVAAGCPDGAIGWTIPIAGSAFADVLRHRRAAVVEDLGAAAAWPVLLPTGPTLLMPLAAGGRAPGVLVVACGRHARPVEPEMVEVFAGQAALALQLARAQREREALAVAGDRERIARDLHDVVIQRLFAAGLQLQGAAFRSGQEEVRERIGRVTADLDATIRDIRDAIFRLRGGPHPGLRRQVRDLVDEAADALGFRPTLHIAGPVDSAVPDPAAEALAAVLRQALANIARHAGASSARVRVTARDGRLGVVVEDDGRGTPGENADGDGLASLRARAEDLGGGLAVGPGTHGGGTRVAWQVPI